MTRMNPLVLDGDTVKLRLMADRAQNDQVVHVDWVRFTVQRRNASDLGEIDEIWTDPPKGYYVNSTNPEFIIWKTLQSIRELPTERHTSAIQAVELARDVCQALGSEFVPAPEVLKGHDFYKHRIAITRAGVEVGWVGFGSSGDSPRQTAQAATLHVNIFGAACTFAAHGWRDRLADLIDKRDAVVTRADLALDCFNGLPGGMPGIVAEYEAGAMDVKGMRPGYDQLGKWLDSAPSCRSFYFGSKQAGKQTNVYEKGDQLYGAEAGNPWIRIEIRYGNKLRVIPSDVLRRPGDFFGGASDWHAQKLAAFGQCSPQRIPQKDRLQESTVDAEVTRVVRWIKETASPALATLWRLMPGHLLWEFLEAPTVPGRLRRFTSGDLSSSFTRLFDPVSAGPALVAG